MKNLGSSPTQCERQQRAAVLATFNVITDSWLTFAHPTMKSCSLYRDYLLEEQSLDFKKTSACEIVGKKRGKARFVVDPEALRAYASLYYANPYCFVFLDPDTGHELSACSQTKKSCGELRDKIEKLGVCSRHAGDLHAIIDSDNIYFVREASHCTQMAEAMGNMQCLSVQRSEN